ncbi:MAG: cytochrome c oxidase subunit 4 [Actinomycetota bacterium]
MKTLAKAFLGVGLFATVVAVAYWFVELSEEEGRVLLAVWVLMTATVAGYLIYHGVFRDRQAAPGDDATALPEDAAGREVGAFPFSSMWPIVFVAGVVVLGAAVIFGLLLLPVGLAIVTIAVLGLMRESRA